MKYRYVSMFRNFLIFFFLSSMPNTSITELVTRD